MLASGTLSSMEVLRRPRPTHGRPRERRSALGSAGSRAYSYPPRFAWPRTAGAPLHAHAHHADHVQRTVGVSVAASVEAMSEYLAGGSLYGSHSTQTGEGSLAPQPLGIVPGHDQQRRRVVGADSWQGE